MKFDFTRVAVAGQGNFHSARIRRKKIKERFFVCRYLPLFNNLCINKATTRFWKLVVILKRCGSPAASGSACILQRRFGCRTFRALAAAKQPSSRSSFPQFAKKKKSLPRGLCPCYFMPRQLNGTRLITRRLGKKSKKKNHHQAFG